MKKIIAIGGGTLLSTDSINKFIIKQYNKNSKLLFIPTASNDSVEYINNIKNYFLKLNIQVDVLYLFNENISLDNIKNQINDADIIYVGGGNTLKMINKWKKFKINELLINAYNSNKIMCGISAGSICWFSHGNSDSRKFKNKKASLIRVSGLGIIKLLNCPHYSQEQDRKESLKKMTKKTKQVAIALDNNVAIFFKNNKFKILRSDNHCYAYKVYWKKNIFFEEKLENYEEFIKFK